MSDVEAGASGLRARGEEALSDLAQALLENPLFGQAMTTAIGAGERAAHAQRSAMGALNIPPHRTSSDSSSGCGRCPTGSRRSRTDSTTRSTSWPRCAGRAAVARRPRHGRPGLGCRDAPRRSAPGGAVPQDSPTAASPEALRAAIERTLAVAGTAGARRARPRCAASGRPSCSTRSRRGTRPATSSPRGQGALPRRGQGAGAELARREQDAREELANRLEALERRLAELEDALRTRSLSLKLRIKIGRAAAS